jgi:hypothetical protein
MFALARPEVGHALESLGAMARTGAASRATAKADTPLRFARTCYDHLAGQVAVSIARRLVARGIVRPRGADYHVSTAGARWLGELEIDLTVIRSHRRQLARQCLDWTEREPHIGGALGAALLQRCLAAGWIDRLPKTRAVRVTDRGSRALRDVVGVDVASMR